jgi:hypothetical protein
MPGPLARRRHIPLNFAPIRLTERVETARFAEPSLMTAQRGHYVNMRRKFVDRAISVDLTNG